jgi:elongation factor P--(R)-beta-lysine ligase
MVDASGLRARAAVLRAVRRALEDRAYLEVQTPALVPSPAMEEFLHPIAAGGAFLRTSPEFALKRILAAGLGRIYEIGPCFRDRERGDWHRREFTMCEWYRVGATLGDLMDEVELVVGSAAEALGVERPGWRRVTVRALFAEVVGIDLATASVSDLSDHEEPWDDAFARRWVSDIEPALRGAVFVTEWPASQAALARVRADGPWPVAERFEAYLGGIELANAFHELGDPAEQRRRFLAANAARVAAGEPPHPVDQGLIAAVRQMPSTCGIALGVDRLVAALCGWEGIARGRVDG